MDLSARRMRDYECRPARIQMKSRASWDGGKLIFSTTNSVEYDDFGSSTEVYSIDNGALVIDETRIRNDGGTVERLSPVRCWEPKSKIGRTR